MREWQDQETFTQEYHVYMQSDTWGKRRLAAFEFYGRKCQACGRVKNLHVHHISYDNLYNEKIDDLRILCKRCHADLHKKFDRLKKASLRIFSERYIREKGTPKRKFHQKALYIGGKIIPKKKHKLSTPTYCVDDDYLL